MKKQPEPATRDQILNILSDDEAARVRTAEAAAQLVFDDEYIDLAQPDLGVQRAGESHPTEDVLSRKAVHEHTWQKVVANLDARKRIAPAPVPGKRSPT